MTTLLETPLLTSQRNVIAEITRAMETWRANRSFAPNAGEFCVEFPDLNGSEFNCSEFIESALTAVRKNAEEKGDAVQATVTGPLPQMVRGQVKYLHHLITLMAASLPEVAAAAGLELTVSYEPKPAGNDVILLSLLISPKNSNEDLYSRLTGLTASFAATRTNKRAGAESDLEAGWQLALALGGSLVLESTHEKNVRLQIRMPLPQESPLPTMQNSESVPATYDE